MIGDRDVGDIAQGTDLSRRQCRRAEQPRDQHKIGFGSHRRLRPRLAIRRRLGKLLAHPLRGGAEMVGPRAMTPQLKERNFALGAAVSAQRCLYVAGRSGVWQAVAVFKR
jgi:hypothetical protein